jgi:hypothetical protein
VTTAQASLLNVGACLLSGKIGSLAICLCWDVVQSADDLLHGNSDAICPLIMLMGNAMLCTLRNLIGCSRPYGHFSPSQTAHVTCRRHFCCNSGTLFSSGTQEERWQWAALPCHIAAAPICGATAVAADGWSDPAACQPPGVRFRLVVMVKAKFVKKEPKWVPCACRHERRGGQL